MSESKGAPAEQYKRTEDLPDAVCGPTECAMQSGAPIRPAEPGCPLPVNSVQPVEPPSPCEPEALHQRLISRMPAIVCELTQEGQTLFVNQAVFSVLGYHPDEVVGRNWWDIFYPGELRLQVDEVYQRFRDGDVADHEMVMAARDGSLKTVVWHSSNHYAPDGVLYSIIGCGIDITSHKRAEGALRASEANYRAIFDASDDAIFIHDIDTGQILDANLGMTQLYGYTLDEVRNLNVEDLSAGKAPYTQEDALTKLPKAAQGKPQIFEWLARDKSGRLFPVEVHIKSAAIRGKDRLLAIVRDIAERRHAQETLKESEQRYRSLYGAVSGGVAVHNADGVITIANDAACDILGLTPDQMRQRTAMDPRWRAIREDGSPFPGDEHPSAITIRTGHPVRDVVMGLYNPRDDQHRWILINSEPVINPQTGRVMEAVITFLDITQRKQAEEDLRKAHAELEVRVQERTEELARANEELWTEVAERKRMQDALATQFNQISTIFDSLNAVVYVADLLTYELLFVNAYGTNLFGQGILGKPCYEAFQAGRAAQCKFCTNDRLVKDGVPQAPYIWEVQNTVTGRWFLCIDKAIPWPDRGLVRMEIAVDITDRKQVEQLREEYVSLISHDLRSPLTVIRAHAEIVEWALDKAGIYGPGRRSVEAILMGVDQMNAMIQDLVDSARLESGKMRIEKQPVDLKALGANIMRKSQAAAGIERVTLEMADDLPIIDVDPDRLERVVVNLVTNALKHSSHDTDVVVSATAVSGKEVVVSVADKGVGIGPEVLPHVFERFYRGNEQHQDGLGLGLYISKMLIEAHGGRIWVDSKLGQGTTFYFSLPVV